MSLCGCRRCPWCSFPVCQNVPWCRGPHRRHARPEGVRYVEEHVLVAALAAFYTFEPTACARLCDDVLDPSGRLLGLVRQAVRPPSTQASR